MNHNFDIVAFLTIDWIHGHRNKYLFYNMAKINSNCKILCIQRPICFFITPFLNRKKLFDWLSGKQNLIEIFPNLFVYQPIVFLHDHIAPHVPLITRVNRKILKFQLSKIIEQLSFMKENIVVWIGDPFQECCLGLLNEKLSIYDCFDDYLVPAGKSFFRNIDQLTIKENNILKKIDIVLTVSNELYEKKSKLNRNTYLLPNAVDAELFGKACDPSTSVACDLLNIPKPIIGTVGNLNERVDFELIRYIALGHPEWSIVLVGSWKDAGRSYVKSELINDLKNKSNVHWMGHQPLEVLPNYLKAFDVCIIPYVADNPFNISCSPLKIYEYLATGKPIVSTNLPSGYEYSEVIRIGKNHEGFEKEIILALEEDGSFRQRRKELANENSWDNRAKDIFSIISEEYVNEGTS